MLKTRSSQRTKIIKVILHSAISKHMSYFLSLLLQTMSERASSPGVVHVESGDDLTYGTAISSSSSSSSHGGSREQERKRRGRIEGKVLEGRREGRPNTGVQITTAAAAAALLRTDSSLSLSFPLKNENRMIRCEPRRRPSWLDASY